MIEIKLEAFEGPMDLLLHLIEINKVDIYDIPISLITRQYLEYLDEMRSHDMDIMSEFIVMASTLINIKSRLLLPREKKENGEEKDPREELVQQLLEYKICKYMSSKLRSLYDSAGQAVFHGERLPEEVMGYERPVDYESLVGDNTLLTLSRIFDDILKRQETRVDPVRSKFGKIEPDEIKLKEKTESLREFIKEHDRFSFFELFPDGKSRLDMIVTFLSILELMKSGEIGVLQESGSEEITVYRRDPP